MTTRKLTESRPAEGLKLGRGLAAALALLAFGVAPILSVAHLFAVSHTTCPVDGELVEQDANAAPPPVSSTAEIGAAHDTPPGDPHAHHHCEAVPRRIAPANEITRAPAQSRAALVEHAVVCVSREAPSCGVPVLHLAPKASPPV